jgi:hypothetical protein
MHLVLGSSSMARQAILREHGMAFQVVSPDIDEKAVGLAHRADVGGDVDRVRDDQQADHPTEVIESAEPRRQPLGRNIITALWGNCTIKAMVGFLFLYPAFVAKAHDASGWVQLGMLGSIGAAAGLGNFAGNFAAARLQLGRPATVVVRAAAAVTVMALAAVRVLSLILPEPFGDPGP